MSLTTEILFVIDSLVGLRELATFFGFLMGVSIVFYIFKKM